MNTIIFDNKWIQVRKIKYYVYAHLKWCNGIGIAILPYRRNASGLIEYLGRFEMCPPHGDGLKLWTKGEEGAYCEWVNKYDAMICNDPLLITMVSRFEGLGALKPLTPPGQAIYPSK